MLTFLNNHSSINYFALEFLVDIGVMFPERLEAEVSAAVKTYKPLKTVMAAPTPRARKRARQDTGGCKWSDHLEEEVSAAVQSFQDEGQPAPKPRQPTGEGDIVSCLKAFPP